MSSPPPPPPPSMPMEAGMDGSEAPPLPAVVGADAEAAAPPPPPPPMGVADVDEQAEEDAPEEMAAPVEASEEDVEPYLAPEEPENAEDQDEPENVEQTDEFENVEQTDEPENVEQTDEPENVEPTDEFENVEPTDEFENVEPTDEFENVEQADEPENAEVPEDAEKPAPAMAEPEAAPEPEPEPSPVIAEPEGLTPGPDDVAATAAAQDRIDDSKDELDAAIDDAMAPRDAAIKAVAQEMPAETFSAAEPLPAAPAVEPEIMPDDGRELTAADADAFGKGLDRMKDVDVAKNREMTLEQARQYLSLTVAPLIKAGMQKIAVEQPADPVEYLAKFLEMHHPDPVVKPVLFVFGARNSGKDIACERIAKEFGWTWIQARDVLRAEVEGKSAEGKAITECILKGQAVPSEITIRLLKKAFQFVTGPGILLDGFPRKIDQAGLFEKEMVGFRGAIHFHVRKEVAMERMMSGMRRYTTFDPKERFEKRWKTYVYHTGPILDYYKASGQLTEVNASRHPEDVFAELRPMFAPIFKA
ncbi:UMP-CMP kinase 3 [Porphyridium purpureum]|uniref:UMP-CMP kinase 3 n=1 Tax=Porphyridium purpureum TaxID=35688 RepID=A0A5J4YJ35_PORPP|nr:UMP-CMP kinase 3 [Porphyridium purpureum]|eukprot:POR5093..scf291_13